MTDQELRDVEELQAERDELRERVERYEKALKDIAAGRLDKDNEHPLGVWASMAGRFIGIARAALSDEGGGG